MRASVWMCERRVKRKITQLKLVLESNFYLFDQEENYPARWNIYFTLNQSGEEMLSYLEVQDGMWIMHGCGSVECDSFSRMIFSGAGDRLALTMSSYVES